MRPSKRQPATQPGNNGAERGPGIVGRRRRKEESSSDTDEQDANDGEADDKDEESKDEKDSDDKDNRTVRPIKRSTPSSSPAIGSLASSRAKRLVRTAS